MGTGLKRHEFGLPAAWNRRGTLGTGPQNANDLGSEPRLGAAPRRPALLYFAVEVVVVGAVGELASAHSNKPGFGTFDARPR